MKPLSIDLRQRIVHAVRHEKNTADVTALRFNVSRAFLTPHQHLTGLGRSVYNYLQLDQDLGDLTPQKSTGRNRRIPAEQEPDLQAQIQAFPDDTLEQHCERWTKQTGVHLSIACMHNSIVRARISLKKSDHAR
jgi:transposase